MYAWLGRITLGAALWLICTNSADAADKINVLIVDGQNNHNWKDTTPLLKKVFEDTGMFAVEVATTPERPKKEANKEELEKYKTDLAAFKPDFAKFDVVVSNYNGDGWSKETRKALDDFVQGGKGLVIIHAANNAFPGWGEFDAMIGMGWRDANYGERLIVDDQGKEVRLDKGKGPGSSHSPTHPFKVVVRNTEHPITKGLPAEWLHATDELYHGLRGPVKNLTLLATAYSDKSKQGTGEHEPMIWTVAYGKGRVFHTPMGHVMGKDLTAMQCAGFQTVVARGTEWAATGKVTLPIPKDFPTDKDVKIRK